MRIITGTHKGRRLKTPRGGRTIRPALSQVREAVFSSLGDVRGCVILDVFAGTGSLGLEGLSRGCRKAYFVDGDSRAIRLIIANIEALGFADKARVFKRRLPGGLRGLRLEESPDIVFCDPPYDKGLVVSTLELLVGRNDIDPRAIYIVEHSPREAPEVRGLSEVKAKRFGQTRVTFLTRP